MGGYAFQPSVRAVQSPRFTPLGIALLGQPGGEATASVGPAVGEGTASAEAQGVGGRAGLHADLTSNLGVANTALSAMGTLGGPVANLAMQGLRAAMTAHNFTTMANQFESMTPAQRQTLSVDAQFALANPQLTTLQEALVSLFSSASPKGYADPLGQLQSPAFKAQREGERGLRPNDPTTQGLVAPDPVAEGFLAAETAATGVTGQDTSTSGPAGGGPAGVGSSGVSASEGQYAKGGYVKDRVLGPGDNEPVLLAGGEFVIRREVVPRHRRLLEAINADRPAAIRREVVARHRKLLERINRGR